MSTRIFTSYDEWKLNESFFVLNKKNRHNIKLFMSTKRDDWEILWEKRQLTFANNSGNMYGIGVYANLEMPEESDIGYSEDVRKKMYGENIYEMELPSNSVFYFYYDYFKQSKVYLDLDEPSQRDYIRAQFDYFGIPLPKEEKKAKFTIEDFIPEYVEDKNGSFYYNEGKCAYKFYKYMSTLYPQREDGTLDSPINGIVYKGRKDGRSIAVWSPYKLRLIRKKIGDGEWETLDSAVKKVEDDKVTKDDEIENVYDGNKTSEKVKVYKDLMEYRGNKTPIGQFMNVKIFDDKKVDATFKSNVPSADGGRHAYPVAHNQYIDDMLLRGYRFNELDAWLKFGVSDRKSDYRLLDPSHKALTLCPKKTTGGVIFVNYMGGINGKVRELNGMEIDNNKKLVLDKCFIDTNDFGQYNIAELNYCVIEDKYFREMKPYKDRHGVFSCISKSQENELVEYVQENNTMSKEKKEEFAKKFGMSVETFEKVYQHLDSLKLARK